MLSQKKGNSLKEWSKCIHGIIQDSLYMKKWDKSSAVMIYWKIKIWCWRWYIKSSNIIPKTFMMKMCSIRCSITSIRLSSLCSQSLSWSNYLNCSLWIKNIQTRRRIEVFNIENVSIVPKTGNWYKYHSNMCRIITGQNTTILISINRKDKL